ncbi:MAG: PTS sugar transporter subunit IIA [candidate division Zixibacteria bacterium]|nr:PTS sugar transporter subunit IIA [candidate division Zixibacteria bacterium]
MKLANLLMERRVNIDLKAKSKDEAVVELLNLIKEEGVKLDYEKVLKAVREREDIEDTSYGHGFAFPHARTKAVDEMYILVGISKSGLEGRTCDSIPVHVVCLLLTPSTIAKLYLQTLSGLAQFGRMPGILETIIKVNNEAEFIKLISEANVTIDKELLVRDVMRHHISSVTPDDTLKDVANEMFRNRLSALAVVENGGKLVGVINDRDLIKAALPDYKSLISNLNYSMDVEPFEELLKQEDKIRVSQLYRDDYEVTTPDTRIVEVAAMMIFKDIRRVFVSTDDKLVGVLLRKDIVNMIIRG